MHWWGPSNSFFASILGKNKYTVVGGFNLDPETTGKSISWDQEANVKLLKDIYAVSKSRSVTYSRLMLH